MRAKINVIIFTLVTFFYTCKSFAQDESVYISGTWVYVSFPDTINQKFIENDWIFDRRTYCSEEREHAFPITVKKRNIYVRGLSNSKPIAKIKRFNENELIINDHGTILKFKKVEPALNIIQNDTAKLFGISNAELHERIKFPKDFEVGNNYKIKHIYDKCQRVILDGTPIEESDFYTGLIFEDSLKNLSVLSVPSTIREMNNPDAQLEKMNTRTSLVKFNLDAINLRTFNSYINHLKIKNQNEIVKRILHLAFFNLHFHSGCRKIINSEQEYQIIIDFINQQDNRDLKYPSDIVNKYDTIENTNIKFVFLSGTMTLVKFKFNDSNDLTNVEVSTQFDGEICKFDLFKE